MPSELSPGPAPVRRLAGGSFRRLTGSPAGPDAAAAGRPDPVDEALRVFRVLTARALRVGAPLPALAVGSWARHTAVLVPALDARDTPATGPDGAFPGAGGGVGGGSGTGSGAGSAPLWFGVRRYPDAAADDGGVRDAAGAPLAAHWGGAARASLWLDEDGAWWLRTTDTPGTGDDPAALDATADAALAAALAAVTDADAEPADATAPTPGFPPVPTVRWRGPDRERHTRGVTDCLEAIAAGEVYQACVAGFFHGRVDGTPDDHAAAAAVFADTVSRHRPARAVFLAGHGTTGCAVAVTSFSPEVYLSRLGEEVLEMPIKGTLPRDRDPADLLASVKDVAENIMIVDLVRHDLGTVAVTGGVTVPDLLTVVPAPGVWHLVSTVRATVPREVTHARLVETTFPPASVTGTPKLAARRFLREWEPESRGVFCGCAGFSAGGVLELAVAIRTCEWTGGGRVRLGVGGGITADSTPEAEWAEVTAKSSTITGGTVDRR
ncbi:aminodeoxychorismate synthase component I [Corynebacterium bovis]|uniref:aminodeoxychorismate synthase component I n=1 Tax=Corynebacterium bovis TaxID=36808 RepID=UPI0024496E40|nr:aminodeoxychorismate synthase component I [Corynebacterium bovis]MDH2455435.1 aminodeoxychorismate synthase component I [Corynebacterium bovis]